MLKNIGSNWLLTAAQILATFFLLPFTLEAIGAERYGVWILITSVTGYLSLLSLGVPMATVKVLAAATVSDGSEEVDRLISTVLAMYVLIGLTALVLGFASQPLFNAAYDISRALLADANAAFAIVVLSASAGFVAQLPLGLLAAKNGFVQRNAAQLLALTIRVVLTVIVLRIVPSVLTVAAIQLCVMLVEAILVYHQARRLWPASKVRLALVDRTAMRGILSFSAWVLLLSIGGQLSFHTDALVIGAYLPMEAIPQFTVASSLAVYLMQFVLGIGSVVMPTSSRLHAVGEVAQIKRLFLKWTKISFILSLTVCIFLALAGGGFVGIWISPEYEKASGQVLSVLMLANILFLPARGVALPILMGTGRAKQPAIAFIVSGVANILLSIALVKRYGLVGVALGTAIPNCIFAFYLFRRLMLDTGTSARELVSYVVIGPLAVFTFAAACLAAAVSVGLHRSLGGFVGTGALWVTATAFLTVAFVLRNDSLIELPACVTAFQRQKDA